MRFKYTFIFAVSFTILCLQLWLSSLLRYLVQMPFYAISFAFLGLSSAGIYTYLRFRDKDHPNPNGYIVNLANCFGASLLFYSVYGFELTRRLGLDRSNVLKSEEAREGFSRLLDFILVDIIVTSICYGLFISLCFFFLGNILSYLYKKHVDQSHQLYLWDLLGASLGCVVGTFFINVIEFSSIPVFLVMVVTVFAVVISLKNNLGKWFRYTSIGLLCVAGYTFYLNQNTRFMEYRHDPHLSVMDYKMEDEVEELWFEWNIYSRLSLIRQEKKGEDTVRHRFSIDGGRGNAHLVPYNPQNPYYIDFKDLFSPPRLAFFLGAPDDVLILMAGAGIDVLQANSYGRGQTDVTGIELNPLIVRKAMSLPEFHLKEFFDQPHIHMRGRGRSSASLSAKKKSRACWNTGSITW